MKSIKSLFNRHLCNRICVGLLIAISIVNVALVVIPKLDSFVQPTYTDKQFKSLEDLYNRSQYRQTNPSAVIPDEALFSYVAGAYVRGLDPILANSEHTPLGKYFIALSIVLLRNDKFVVIPFGLLTLSAIWLLSRKVLKYALSSALVLALFSFEKLFLNQFRFVPLLDIIQLPFVLLALYAFLIEEKKERFILTAIFLGLVMATKTVVPALLLIVSFVLYFFLSRRYKATVYLFIALPLSLFIFMMSYVRTFLDGYTLWDFFGFQKWIFLYQKSKLIYPFSVWRLVFFNQWQTWWGNMLIVHADDWMISWPITTLVGLIAMAMLVSKKIKDTTPIAVLILWFGIYGAFLSIGTISSRFLLLMLPVAYIISAYLGERIFSSIKNKHVQITNSLL